MKSKIVQIVLLFIVLGFSITNTKAQHAVEFKGSVMLALFNDGSWQSNFFSVDLQSEPPIWHLILKSQSLHEETFADSNRVEVVTYNDNVVPSRNGINTATIKLFSGSRPLSSRIEEHIWFALFCQNTFFNKKTPFNDTGLCIEEPCVFTELKLNPNDSLPLLAKWHNERADKYNNQTRIEGEYRCLSMTNLPGMLAVPSDSELFINIVSTNGESQPASFSSLKLEDINVMNSPPETSPTIRGRVLVFDYRLDGDLGRTFVRYNIYTDTIPKVTSAVLQAAEENTPAFKKEEKDRLKGRWIIAGFALISLCFLAFAIRSKTKNNKNKQTNNIV